MAAILVTSKKLIHRHFASQLFRVCSRVPNNSCSNLFSTPKTPKTTLLNPDFGYSIARVAGFRTRSENPSETYVENPLWGNVPSGETLDDNSSGDETTPSSENPSDDTLNPFSEKPSGEIPPGKNQNEKEVRMTRFSDTRVPNDINHTRVTVDLSVWVDDKRVRHEELTKDFMGNAEQVTDRLKLKKIEVQRDWCKVFEKDFKKLEFLRLLITFCKACLFRGDTVAAKDAIDRVLMKKFPHNSPELKYLRSVLPEVFRESTNYQEDKKKIGYLKKIGLSLAKRKAVIKAACSLIISLIVKYCFPGYSEAYGTATTVAGATLPLVFQGKKPEPQKGKPETIYYNKGMLVIMDAVGFGEEDISVTLERNYLRLEGGTVTVRGGRKIDEKVFISEEDTCDPKKVRAQLSKGELLVFFPKDSLFTSFFTRKVKKGKSFTVAWGDVKPYLIK